MGEPWDTLVRWEHAVERALGLHPPPDPGSGATPGASSAPARLIPAKPGAASHAAAIQGIAANLKRYWPMLTGKSTEMPPQALELALAQAGLESTWGLGWSDKTASGAGDMRGSNNYGARQCGAHDTGATSWRCVPYGDTTPNADGTSTPIAASFRYYQDGEGRTAAENGAYYFLQDLTKHWNVIAELESGSVRAYAHRLGPDKANGGLYYYGGFGKNFAEREANYAKAIVARLPEVAAALGHDHVHATVDSDPPLAGASDPGGYDPVTWVEIDAPGGYRIKTNAEPLAVGGVPVPMSFEQLLAAARAMNALPLTSPISDARWAAASVKTNVPPVNDPRGALQVGTTDGNAQAVKFSQSYGPLGTALRDGGHKDMVLARNLVPSGPNSMIFYGWRNPNGSTIQKGISSHHDRKWVEYDSYASLVRRDATKNGQPVDLLTELQQEGPLAAPASNGLPPLPGFLVAELGGITAPAGPLASIPALGNIRGT